MKATEIVSALQGKKGQHVSATWQRQCKVKKACDALVFKRTTCFVRSGINYANLADVREGIEAGTREAVQGLPWGAWREGMINYVIDHKDKEYIRLYPATFDNLRTPKVTWLLDGREVDYSAVEPYLLASEKRHEDDERPACFTVNAADIISIAE